MKYKYGDICYVNTFLYSRDRAYRIWNEAFKEIKYFSLMAIDLSAILLIRLCVTETPFDRAIDLTILTIDLLPAYLCYK